MNAIESGTSALDAFWAIQPTDGRARVVDGTRTVGLVSDHLLRRALLVLGPSEAAVSMSAFVAVLLHGGWRPGTECGPGLLATASGSAFAVIAVAQMVNAFVCRSETSPVWRLRSAVHAR